MMVCRIPFSLQTSVVGFNVDEGLLMATHYFGWDPADTTQADDASIDQIVIKGPPDDYPRRCAVTGFIVPGSRLVQDGLGRIVYDKALTTGIPVDKPIKYRMT